MDNNIHVALAVYDPKGTYSQHAGVTVTSIFENTKSKVTVHILHDDTLTDLNRERFLNTAKRYGQSIDLINVEEYKNKIGGDVKERAEQRLTVGALYRLFIPEVLSGLDKVIYLDCDIVVNLDIAELWNADIGDNYLGAAKDKGALKSNNSLYDIMCHKLNACSFDNFFNSGVLLMNLNKIREFEENLFNMTAKWLLRYGHTTKLVDQTALNGIFRGRVKIIDNKFNYFANNNKLDDDIPGCIVHYAGDKPWRVLINSKIYMIYWHYFLKSEWMNKSEDDKYALEDVENLIGTLSGIASSQPKLHAHTKQCYAHIWERLKFDVFQVNRLKIIPLLIKEFIARIKYGD